MVGYSLCWDSYKASICGGFSSLQQNGEFVDMTLAADGHLVKVHQVLIAMVSPYLKELMTSAPCPHPVIFLNNISFKTLSSLLEYVYTGEVVVSSDSLTQFIQAAKSLHIKGLEDLNNMTIGDNNSPLEDNSMYHVSGTKQIRLPADANADPIHIPAAAKKIILKHNSTSSLSLSQEVSTKSVQDYSSMMDVSEDHFSDDDFSQNEDDTNKTVQVSVTKEPAKSNLQYSVSNRGSLQVILNRYIYNLHSTPNAKLRRWRCVDYRNGKCKAYLVTKGNVVLNRANLHNHPFHDKKILKKIENKSIFSAIDDVQEYKLREQERQIQEYDAGNDAVKLEGDAAIKETHKKEDDSKSMWKLTANKQDS